METSHPFNLLKKPFRKLKTIIGFKRPFSDLSLDNKFASSSDYVNCEVVSQKNETLYLLPIGNNNTEASFSDPIRCDDEVVCQKTDTLEQLPLENIEDALMEDVNDGYEVFLSFRGADVRNNFVSHLYKELKEKGIHTFMDERELKRGKPLSFLLNVIKKCKIVIVVFSTNYASSDWCLEELVEVVKCMKSEKQIVIPIFYNLDLDEQTEFYSKALENHQKVFENEKIENWISALSTVAEIAGWDSRKSWNDATLIENIVRDVSDKLISKSSDLETRLVGIDLHLTRLDEKLGLGCDDVRMIGIWGPGGVGKTTIADFIYHRETRNYDKCCRIKNIKDKFAKEGAVALQKELLSQILLEKDLNIWDKDVGCDLIRRRLQHKKVLIVLDDVDELGQLKVLAKDVQSFGHRSRIIITTRDKRLLEQHDVKYIYDVPFLEGNKALQLFSLHAFKENQPPNDFHELSNKVISHAQGLPLALEILGHSLYKRDKGFWESELEKLQRIPNDEIYWILRTSYDSLDDFVKKVFLDIAFFFNGMSKVTAENVLDGCEFYPKRALSILEERALITISDNHILNMHDLIRTMGYEIVREEGKNNPNKRSRICHSKDVHYALTNFEGGTSIEGICLDMNELSEPVYLKPNAFEKMIHLRILIIFHSYQNEFINQREIHFLEGLSSLPKELRYFHWDNFPLQTLPFSSFGENLVEILLYKSKLEYLWEGKMVFKKLKKIILEGSRNLKALPDLSGAPNIEEIILYRCRNCNELPSDLRYLQKLKILNISKCLKIDKLPMLPPSLVYCDLGSSSVTELSSGLQCIGEVKSLKNLYLLEVPIAELPQTIEHLHELKTLELGNCENLARLPQWIGKLTSLKYLGLSGVPIAELPQSIKHLHELEFLELCACKNLMRLPQCIGKLKSLKVLNLIGVSITELPQTIKHLHKLECLYLSYCKNLVRLPSCMHMLASLQAIKIDRVGLVSLPKLPPSLKSLSASCCESLETLECINWIHFGHLLYISFAGCNKLDDSSCNEIMEFVRVRTHNDKKYQFSSERKKILCIIPKKEITEWFEYRGCESSSITVKLPLFSHQIQGFTFFSVVKTAESNDLGLSFVVTSNLINLKSKVKARGRVGVDDVVVWDYYFNVAEMKALTKYLGCELQFNISCRSMCVGDGLVKEWGVHMIYDEEVNVIQLLD